MKNLAHEKREKQLNAKKKKIGRPHSITLKFCKKRLESKLSEKIVIDAF